MDQLRRLSPDQEGGYAQRHTYQAPGVFLIEQHYANEAGEAAKAKAGALNFHTYMTPLSPGVTRIVLRTLVPADAPPPPLAERLATTLVLPHHHYLSLVFESDMVILHEQERTLRAAAAAAPDAWRRLFFLATAGDTGVACARNWLDAHGGGGPFGAAAALAPSVAADHKVVLDRGQRHAAHCPACRRGGERAAAAARALGVLAGVAASGAVAGAAVGAPLGAVLGAAVAAPALGAAARAADVVSQSTRFVDWVHAYNE